MFRKILFCSGTDGAGKTTKIKQVINADPNSFVYFRSNYQMGSDFAGEKVNLDESLKHDWRILFDFINQTSDLSKILFVDRGFLSSYVYSKVIRHVTMDTYLEAYLEMFKPMSEFWIFIRRDSGMKEQWEKDVNEEFKCLVARLRLAGCEVKIFYRDDGMKFSTSDFSDLCTEIAECRFDCYYYDSRINSFLNTLSIFEKKNGIIISDLDGTILKLGYPEMKNAELRIEVVNYINSLGNLNEPLLIITGREKIEDYIHLKLVSVIDRPIYYIWNNKNIGLSSKVLKEYCIDMITDLKIPFTYLDDREDVMQHLYKREYIKLGELNIFEVNRNA